MIVEIHFILKHSIQFYTSIFGYQKYFFSAVNGNTIFSRLFDYLSILVNRIGTFILKNLISFEKRIKKNSNTYISDTYQ